MAAECRYGGSAGVGETCELAEDCMPGLFCAGLGPKACVQVCRIDDMRSCPDGSACVAQAYSPAGTGVCVVSASAFF